MPQKGQTDWNLAREEIKQISELAAIDRKKQVKAKAEKTQQALLEWHDFMEGMWSAVRPYTGEKKVKEEEEEKEDINTVQDALDSIGARLSGHLEDVEGVYQEMRRLDTRIHKLRIEEGLGIPRKTKLDPENAAVQGLRNG